ncbi:MAG: GAF domain-containing protein [Chiayiivirga sp.]|nr:GAF domain-containing protein [Chiayiivirga sp.]
MDHEVPGSDSVRALDESARQLALLNDIARIATQDIELRPMLQRIVDELHRAYGWEFVSCVSVNHVENRFVCEALHSDVPTEVEVGYSRALGSGIVGEVASSGHTIDLDDVRGQDNFIDTLHGTRSELCVPVCHQGVVLAVLNVESRRPAAFHGQRALLETVAEQIAGMIAIAKLHRELGRARRTVPDRERAVARGAGSGLLRTHPGADRGLHPGSLCAGAVRHLRRR